MQQCAQPPIAKMHLLQRTMELMLIFLAIVCDLILISLCVLQGSGGNRSNDDLEHVDYRLHHYIGHYKF